MKKFLLLIAAMLLCLALVACGDEPKDPAGVETGDETGTQSPVVDDTPKNKLPDGIKAEDYHFFKTFDLPADFRQAAVDFMISHGGIDASRLEAIGKGSSELKNKENPMAPENRRTEFIVVE